MKLKNFSDQFESLEDYILKITYKIWEERGIDRIREWYGKKAPVYTPISITHDVEKVVQGTIEALNAFPDRILLGEDIIAKEYEADSYASYYSSHRIFSSMTHLGNDAIWGPPTNKKVKFKVIADCLCQNNQVIEEWLVRDQKAIALGLGQDIERVGKDLGVRLKEKNQLLSPEEYVSLWSAGLKPEVNPQAKQFDLKEGASKEETSLVVNLVAKAMEKVFAEDDFNSIYQTHDRAAYAYFPGYSECHGTSEIIKHLLAFLSSFTTRDFKVHHAISLKEANAYARASLRWTLRAKHGGTGLYGKPSNKELVVMGISHFEIKNNLIHRAYHLFDDLSIWAQIEAN